MSVENETLPQSPIDTEQVLSQLSESCPLSNLLETKTSELSDEELDAQIDKLRQLHESPASLKKALSLGGSSSKPKTKTKPQLDLI